jgi:ribonucleotide monophosphatase NagD (HAD superfamily)
MELAGNAGMTSIMVMTGHGREQWEKAGNDLRVRVAHVADDLNAAVAWILNRI